jgi:hypothetical protein
MVRIADSNGDGMIQFDEFVGACTGGKAIDTKKI